MANVMITLEGGQERIATNTTLSALVTALGTGDGQATITLPNGEQTTVGNDEVVSLVQEATGTTVGGAGGNEESGSGRFLNA